MTSWPSIDHTNITHAAPSRVSPVAAAQSRCLRPWPKTIKAGIAAKAAANNSVPVTKTAVGQAALGVSSVHHGTPNSSSVTARMMVMRRQCRGDRRGSADSTTSAGVSVIAPRSRVHGRTTNDDATDATRERRPRASALDSPGRVTHR